MKAPTQARTRFWRAVPRGGTQAAFPPRTTQLERVDRAKSARVFAYSAYPEPEPRGRKRAPPGSDAGAQSVSAKAHGKANRDAIHHRGQARSPAKAPWGVVVGRIVE